MKLIQSKKLALATSFAIASVTNITLAANEVDQFDKALQLEDLVVTANRLPTAIKNTMVAVSIFTREDIERLNPAGMFDLLNRVPGVQTAPSGGRGSATGVFIRGTNTAHTLILIDGIRVGSATTGGASLQHLDINQIERIEVLKGSNSTIYGADALGGVIQIFTLRGKNEGINPRISLAGGSFGTAEGSLGVSGGNQVTKFSINLAGFYTDGFDRTATSFASDNDKDKYTNSSLSFNLSHQINADFEIGLSSLYQQGKTHYDNPFGRWVDTSTPENPWSGHSTGAKPYDKFNISSNSFYLASQLMDFWQARLEVGHSEDKQEIQDKLYRPQEDKINNYRDSVHLTNNFILTESQSLLLGADYLNDKVRSNTDYDVNNRYNLGAFVQYSFYTEIIGFNLGARYDDNQQFGSQTTFNAAASYYLNQANQLIVSYAEGFRAPTFNDLYWPFMGNPNLKAETSKSYELKWRSDLAPSTQLETAVYRTEIEDLISWDSSVNAANNVNKARINGFEANLTQKMDCGWQANVGASLISPIDRETNNQLTRRAKRTLNLDIDRKINDISIGANWQLVSHSYDDAANTTRIAGYGLLNLRAAWQATQALSFDAKINNILDKKYSRAAYNYTDINFNTGTYFYKEERVSFMLGVHWTPKF